MNMHFEVMFKRDFLLVIGGRQCTISIVDDISAPNSNERHDMLGYGNTSSKYYTSSDEITAYPTNSIEKNSSKKPQPLKRAYLKQDRFKTTAICADSTTAYVIGGITYIKTTNAWCDQNSYNNTFRKLRVM